MLMENASIMKWATAAPVSLAGQVSIVIKVSSCISTCVSVSL